eukprot:CAMPEP_0114249762 /NCGR_PEP_ID=MMETSP0058-20121206/14325_1 /TAXON_ID=36894 /ORGANISM="Pyramimonas parkeae, CCMP726" /LENGTH=253 /DNA_ID=CAMNT_0001363349 /DNA_START=187 /DNA_END=948 /DNA_ORIENTATION=-
MLPDIGGTREKVDSADASDVRPGRDSFSNNASLPAVGATWRVEREFDLDRAETADSFLMNARSYQKYQSQGHVQLLAGDWKRDNQLQQWSVQVDRRKTDAAKKKLRQANKDANWVLARRTAQAKNLRDRQKAEESEARAQAQHTVEIRHKYEAGVRKANIMLATVPRPESHSRQYKPRSSLLKDDHEGPLQWQMPSMHESSPRDREMGVWVRPGVFTTKMVREPAKTSASKSYTARRVSLLATGNPPPASARK